MTVTDEPGEQARLRRWEDATEWPMAGLAVLFLAIYAVEVLARGLSPGWHLTLVVADYAIWVCFVLEFAVRLGLAHRRGRYLLHHLLDLTILVLPFLRTMRVLRLIPLLRALNRWMADSMRGRIVVYGASTAVLLVFAGALAVLDAERGHPGADITSFGRAIWWSIVTICTVGYGDFVPVTPEGRLVAVTIMIGGVMLVGAVTASFATWLIDRLRVEEAEQAAGQAATRADLREVHAQLRGVQAELAELKALIRERQVDERPASASS